MDKQRIARAAGRTLIGASLVLLPAMAAASPTASKAPVQRTAATLVAPPNLQGTVALPARLSRYSGGWERARRTAAGDPRLARIIAPARTLGRAQQVAFVQAAVHRNIRWISDATEWGRHDYWASASETLAHGAGDMEDRAIVKMEALKNLGFAPGDLFMTLGTDRVAGPVTVLIVRLNGRFVMLDDTGSPPLLVDQRPDFQPMLTLGHGGSWLHGHRRTAQQLAAKAPRPAATAVAESAQAAVRR